MKIAYLIAQPFLSYNNMDIMKNTLFTAICALALSFAPAAYASHAGYIGSIDAINATFGNGGGNWQGTLANGTDNAWIVFNATAGDNLNLQVSAGGFYKNALLLTDAEDGNFSVGDSLNVGNFNVSHVGEGTDLRVLATIGSLEFSDTGVLAWVAQYTGQYAIAINAANDDSYWAQGLMNVSVTGATVQGTTVPEPATLGLLGLGLAAIGFSRRKRA